MYVDYIFPPLLLIISLPSIILFSMLPSLIHLLLFSVFPLFMIYFYHSQLQGACPRLGEIITVILEELLNDSPTFVAESDPSQIRHIVEGLLAHFFSVHLTAYNSEDILWLLEMANMQTQWQATYLLSEILEVRLVCCGYRV